jgi:lysophospholipase L1-like esterase
MKKSITLMPLFVTCLTLVSCSQEVTPINTEKTYSIPDNLNKFNIEGRYEIIDQSITCDWSGSAIEFDATCSGKVSINVTSTQIGEPLTAENGKYGLTMFSSFVDGVRTKNIKVDNETKEIELATDLTNGVHNFKFVRQTNVYMSQAIINSISLTGELIKNQNRDTLLEFIGDSYTTGYSLQGVTENGGYSTDLDDPLDAYAYQTALNLDSDYMLTAFSGAGFGSGYTNFTVPQVYEKQNYFRDQNKVYSPDRVPDLVVINLGTNDVAQVGFNNKAAYKKGVEKLIKETKDAYVDYVPLVFCTDSTHENNDSAIEEAMKEYLPDVEYKMVELTTNNHKNNYHPDSDCGHKQGEELAQAIKEYLPQKFAK